MTFDFAPADILFRDGKGFSEGGKSVREGFDFSKKKKKKMENIKSDGRKEIGEQGRVKRKEGGLGGDRGRILDELTLF